MRSTTSVSQIIWKPTGPETTQTAAVGTRGTQYGSVDWLLSISAYVMSQHFTLFHDNGQA